MRISRGLTLLEVLVTVVCLALLSSVFTALGRPGAVILPWKGLNAVASATALYQSDNANRVPIVLSYKRGIVKTASSGSSVGINTWSWGGKNNSGFWASAGPGGVNDVEAADRPMNPYVYPGRTFYAPPPPATLPANDPHRLDEAFRYKDPFDKATRQRSWPNTTPGITAYNDVGTSYFTEIAWLSKDPQISTLWATGQPVAAITEVNRRIAVGDRVNPSRFVWLADQNLEIVVDGAPGTQITNGYGEINKSTILYLDGHVGYESATPGVFSTPKYTLLFE